MVERAGLHSSQIHGKPRESNGKSQKKTPRRVQRDSKVWIDFVGFNGQHRSRSERKVKKLMGGEPPFKGVTQDPLHVSPVGKIFVMEGDINRGI